MSKTKQPKMSFEKKKEANRKAKNNLPGSFGRSRIDVRMECLERHLYTTWDKE